MEIEMENKTEMKYVNVNIEIEMENGKNTWNRRKNQEINGWLKIGGRGLYLGFEVISFQS